MHTHLTDQQRCAALQHALPPWFATHKRRLPWRTDYAPYAVWISEIMLQQTQMERGVTYFERWMRRFPDVTAVADASEEEILKYWEGLGYYSRARNLHKAAQIIAREYGGRFPSEPEVIRALPGIGPYTAGAIASIAFNQPLPCIDANVERVLTRVFDIDSPVRQEPAASRVRELAQTLVPHTGGREHNQAMMELGALVCRKKPLCGQCPLRDICESNHLGIAQERPVSGKKSITTPLQVVTGVLHSGGRVFMQKRLDAGVWARLWEFPGGRIEAGESPEQAVVREFMEETGFAVRVVRPLGVIRHGYTTYRITLYCFALELEQRDADATPPPPVLTAATAWQWLLPHEVAALALPAAHRKLADSLWEGA